MAKIRTGQNKNKAFKPTSLANGLQVTGQHPTKISAATDLKRLSGSSNSSFKSIQFGAPSSSGVRSRSSASAGTEWSGLVKTASGGAASLIGGNFLEVGINSLISGLTSLFGESAGKAEVPLTRFALPESQQQALYMTSQGLSTTASFSNGPAQNATPQGAVYRQSEIVQAVKNALLTSCSLNDVIAEI